MKVIISKIKKILGVGDSNIYPILEFIKIPSDYIYNYDCYKILFNRSGVSCNHDYMVHKFNKI